MFNESSVPVQFVHTTSFNSMAPCIGRIWNSYGPLQSFTCSTSERMGHKYNVLNLKMEDLPMTRHQTLKDAVLKQACSYVEQCWPHDRAKVPEHCVTFYKKLVIAVRGRYFIVERKNCGSISV